MCLQTWEIKVDQLETWVERFSVEAAVNKMGLGMLTDLRDDRLSIVNKMGLEMQSAFGVDRPEEVCSVMLWHGISRIPKI